MSTALLPEVVDAVDVTTVHDLLESVPPPTCEWRDEADGPECGIRATWLLSLSCGHSAYLEGEHQASVARALGSAETCLCMQFDVPPRHPRGVDVTYVWSEVPQ